MSSDAQPRMTMEQRETSGALLVVRRLLGVSVLGLAAVGVIEMQAFLPSAVTAVGTFAFVVASIVLWQNGVREGRLWRAAAGAALRAVTALLVFVGSISVLEGATALVSLAVLLAWWALRGARAPRRTPALGGPAPTTAEDRPALHRPSLPPGTPASPAGTPPVPPARTPPTSAATAGKELELWLRPGARIVRDVQDLVRSLDTPSLARAWQACRTSAEPAASVGEQLELARLRAALLDELERRDPVAFASWLARGAPDGPPLPVDGR